MINGCCVGLDMGEYTIDVTPRRTLAYAAAIDAPEEVYFDDARAGGIVAPPPFTVSLEWPIMITPQYIAGLGLNEDNIFSDLVHAFQDTTFHRAIRPGDRLEVKGMVAQVRKTGAGAVVVSRITTRDTRSGETVAEGWFGSLFRGVAISGEGGTAVEPPSLRGEPGLEGPGIGSTRSEIPRGLPHVYTECAQIWNPIHTERSFALQKRLPDIILHGTCTWAKACLTIIRTHAGGNPLRLKRFGGRFSRMVIPGSHIVVEHRADRTRQGVVHFAVRNAAGEYAITHGVAAID
jgi:acyl dehydratase